MKSISVCETLFRSVCVAPGVWLTLQTCFILIWDWLEERNRPLNPHHSQIHKL